jgi:hypothetical protein
MATHAGSLVRAAFNARSGPAHRIRPPLQRGERVLLAERAEGSAPIVATTRALYHRGADGWQRWPWEETGRVHWDEARHTLQVTRYADGPPETVSVRLLPLTRIPALARERVAATILLSTRVDLKDSGQAVITARCRPGTSEAVWVVQLADGVDPADPEVQATVDTAIRDLRPYLGF